MFSFYKNMFNKFNSTNIGNYKYRIIAWNNKEELRYYCYSNKNIWFLLRINNIINNYANYIIKFDEIYIEYINSKFEIKDQIGQ